MKTKAVPVADERIRFVMSDGSIIMNRKADLKLYHHDKEFTAYSLEKDANEHGVRIIRHSWINNYTIEALVAWK